MVHGRNVIGKVNRLWLSFLNDVLGESQMKGKYQRSCGRKISSDGKKTKSYLQLGGRLIGKLKYNRNVGERFDLRLCENISNMELK